MHRGTRVWAVGRTRGAVTDIFFSLFSSSGGVIKLWLRFSCLTLVAMDDRAGEGGGRGVSPTKVAYQAVWTSTIWDHNIL